MVLDNQLSHRGPLGMSENRCCCWRHGLPFGDTGIFTVAVICCNLWRRDKMAPAKRSLPVDQLGVSMNPALTDSALAQGATVCQVPNEVWVLHLDFICLPLSINLNAL